MTPLLPSLFVDLLEKFTQINDVIMVRNLSEKTVKRIYFKIADDS